MKELDRSIARVSSLREQAQLTTEEVKTLLLESGAIVDSKDKGGYTALMLAASNNHPQVVDLLISKGSGHEPTL